MLSGVFVNMQIQIYEGSRLTLLPLFRLADESECERPPVVSGMPKSAAGSFSPRSGSSPDLLRNGKRFSCMGRELGRWHGARCERRHDNRNRQSRSHSRTPRARHRQTTNRGGHQLLPNKSNWPSSRLHRIVGNKQPRLLPQTWVLHLQRGAGLLHARNGLCEVT